MPAEIGYGSIANLAAEITKPPAQPTKVTNSDDTVEEPQATQASADEGTVTEDRGQNLNISA